MKRLPLFSSLFALAACGSGTPSSPPDSFLKGTAFFTTDRGSCTYAGTRSITFFIANDSVGIESLAAGVTSTGYLTKATSEYKTSGNPVVQARIGNPGSGLWTLRTNINVPVGSSVTHVFSC